MGDVLAICDKETFFVQILADFMKKKYRTDLEIEAFDDIEKLMAAAEKDMVKLCLISDIWIDTPLFTKLSKQVENLILLSSKKKNDVVFRFQSVEKVSRSFLALCQEREIHILEERNRSEAEKTAYIIAFYSPSRQLIQSAIALCVGERLAENHRVLYINFESFSGFSYLLEKEYTQELGDLFLGLKEEKGRFGTKIESILEHFGNVDYIPPMRSLPDWDEIRGTDWLNMIEKTIAETDYEIIILDLTENVRGFLSLLEISNEIYNCIGGHELDMAKQKEYEEFLKYVNKDDILLRTKKSIVPRLTDVPSSTAMFTHKELNFYIDDLLKQPILDVGNCK